jgi:hypothetical protein
MIVDPLGPVDQLPDVPRDLACDLTASTDRCSPPVPDSLPDFDPPANLGGGATGSGFATIVVVLLVIALLAVVVWIVVSMIRNRSATEGDDLDDLDDLDEELADSVDERIVDVDYPPDRWRRAAGEHRAAGRFRDSVRCEYRALVGDLARAGHVDEIPGRTSGEEREQIRVLAPAVAPSFDEAADIFDGAWFDDAVVTATDDQRFVEVAAAVLQPIGGRR